MHHVPLDGAVGLKLEAPAAIGWQNGEELLALVAELLDQANRLYFVAHTKKGTPVPTALEVPRPERTARQTDPVRPKRNATSEELAEMFGSTTIRYTGPPVGGPDDPVHTAAEDVS